MNKPLQEMTNEELWALFPIILSEHRAEWAKFYEQEKDTIISALGTKNITRINHMGSTSVPGLVAKPTIDILLEIPTDTDIPFLTATLISIGYICNTQPNNPAPHLMFMKGYTPQGFREQAVHLHVRFPGDWDELYFRDYLRSHPETAEAYGKLKQNLKLRYEHNRDAYTEAKTGFIQETTRLARKELENKHATLSTSL
ncbi:GrpB family protein [Butyricimonas virosa]|uniref:GrpB family protein n=1 Tax=Butyricimonas virosa TaxID=544645 RepID=UPI00242DE082|nr:GrpB family protein [Butyricimonas virosa]